MKALFIFCLSILSLTASSQCSFGPAQWINAYYEYKALKARYILQVPRSLPASSCRDTGMIHYNPIDSSIYWWTGFNDLTFIAHADQGLIDSGNTVQLGEPLNQSNNIARLYQKREIPLNGFPFYWWDTLNNSNAHAYTAFNDTSTCSLIGKYKVSVKQQADTNSDAGMAWEYRPRNYGYPYAGYKPNGALATARSWTWGYSQNDPGGLTMPDNVYGGGYNIINATARADTGDAAASMRLETSFQVFGEPVFELHWPEITHFNGSMQRVNSYYMGKSTGRVLHEQNLDNWTVKRAVGTNPGGEWIGFTSNSGDFPSINMTGTHAHSIDGIISFVDSVPGEQFQVRSIDADLELSTSTKGQTATFSQDGSVFINQNVAPASPANGTTQVGQNDDGSSPQFVFNAQLAVCSQHKVFLPPQMTTTQKLAMLNVPKGGMVFDMTLNQMSYWNGTAWINF